MMEGPSSVLAAGVMAVDRCLCVCEINLTCGLTQHREPSDRFSSVRECKKGVGWRRLYFAA